MGWVTTAIVGSAVIGAGASIYSANKAENAQKDAANKAKAASDAQIAFQQEQYNDWKGIFGNIEQNLSKYYNNLTPEHFEALGLNNLEKSYANTKEQVQKQLARRGLDTSGAAAQSIVDLTNSKAQAEANLRTQAPEIANQQKMKFLGLGLGQQGVLQQGIANAYGNQAAMQQRIANNEQAIAANSWAGVGNAIGSGINSYMTYQALNSGNTPANPMNIPTLPKLVP